MRQHPLGVLRFAGRDADQLDPLEREHHHLQRHRDAEQAERHEALAAPQVRDSRGGPERCDAEGEDRDADADHPEDHHHLDQREPELEFAEQADRDAVGQVQHHQRHQRRKPARQVRQPVVHVDRYGGDLGHADRHPHEPVRPAGCEAGERADELLGIRSERAGDGPVHQQLAKRTHDEEDRDAADRVAEDQPRAGHADRAAGAEEQPDADRAADGDHLNVPVLEAALQPLLVGAALAGATCGNA